MRLIELSVDRGESLAAPGALRSRISEMGASKAANATAAWLLAFVFVLALAFDDGGYYPTAWNWAALVLLFVSAFVVVLRREVRLGRLEAAVPVGLLGLTVWGAASAAWSSSATEPLLQAQRTVAYTAAACAALLLVRSRSYRALLAGVWAAIVVICGYALLTRLFPEHFGVIDTFSGSRLEEPLGYWNSLGLLAVMGTFLALGFAARSRYAAVRAVAAASTVVCVLALYFTYSRGAWIALAIGVVAMVALDPRRLQVVTALLVLAPWSALAVWRASGTQLAHVGGPLAKAEHAGHDFLPFLLGMGVAAAAAILVFTLLERRLEVPKPFRVAYIAALALCLAAGLGAVMHRYGSPDTVARDAYHSLLGGAKSTKNGNLNARLFTLSLDGRIPQWKVAWREHQTHPWLGSGLGTFERFWNEYRPGAFKVRNVHNLYLETLAELGPVGLALLVLALAAPLAAAVKARRHTLVPATAGAYVAFLAHAAVDWDWQLVAVGMAALFCGAGILAAARGSSSRGLPLRTASRATALAVVAVLGIGVFVGLRGNRAMAASDNAASVNNFAEAEAEARTARVWAPWSATPWQLLGQAQAAVGARAAARRSFRQALAKDSTSWEIWLDLAVVSRGAERRRAFAAATRLDPFGPEIASWKARAGRGGG